MAPFDGQGFVPPPRARRYDSLQDRILANIIETPPPPHFVDAQGLATPCWFWNGKRTSQGYGFITLRKKVWTPEGLYRGRQPRNFRVHRVSLHVFRGFPLDFPDYGCHMCSNKPCCHPFHVEPGTNSENQLYYNRVEKPRLAAIASTQDGVATREPGED